MGLVIRRLGFLCVLLTVTVIASVGRTRGDENGGDLARSHAHRYRSASFSGSIAWTVTVTMRRRLA